MSIPSRDVRRKQRFSAGGWEYMEWMDGVQALSRLDGTATPIYKRILNGILGKQNRPLSPDEFTIIFDTVRGDAEKPDGAIQRRFTLYRDRTRVGEVHENMLSEVVLNQLEKQAISAGYR